jgi:Dullard-like phosphatase family protein
MRTKKIQASASPELKACRALLKDITVHEKSNKKLKFVASRLSSPVRIIRPDSISPTRRGGSLNPHPLASQETLCSNEKSNYLSSGMPKEIKDFRISTGTSLGRQLATKEKPYSGQKSNEKAKISASQFTGSTISSNVNIFFVRKRSVKWSRSRTPEIQLTPPIRKYQNYLMNPGVDKYFKFTPLELRSDMRPIDYILQAAVSLRSLHNDKFVNESIADGAMAAAGLRVTLVVGLDDTLVHCCNFDGPLQGYESTVSYQSSNDGSMIVAEMNYRPHLKAFLRNASKWFKVVVFSGAEEKYTRAVCHQIDPEEKYITRILSRNDCIKTAKGYHVKDLRSVTGSDTSSTILLDCHVHSFAPQIYNGIPILPYKDEKSDSELLKLIPFLEVLKSQPDMPQFLKKYFKMSKVMHCKEASQAKGHLLSVGTEL